jgi:hypothetical protein
VSLRPWLPPALEGKLGEHVRVHVLLIESAGLGQVADVQSDFLDP